MGIVYYDIVSVENPTTVKLSASVPQGTYSFMTYPFGTMENPFPATGQISPKWKLTRIPMSDKVKRIQVVGEFPSGNDRYGGMTTINLAFNVKDAAAAPK